MTPVLYEIRPGWRKPLERYTSELSAAIRWRRVSEVPESTFVEVETRAGYFHQRRGTKTGIIRARASTDRELRCQDCGKMFIDTDPAAMLCVGCNIAFAPNVQTLQKIADNDPRRCPEGGVGALHDYTNPDDHTVHRRCRTCGARNPDAPEFSMMTLKSLSGRSRSAQLLHVGSLHVLFSYDDVAAFCEGDPTRGTNWIRLPEAECTKATKDQLATHVPTGAWQTTGRADFLERLELVLRRVRL